MSKRFKCSECGASIIAKKTTKNSCNFCGALLDLNNTQEIKISADVNSAAKEATSFIKSLEADVNGQKASIVEMWQSLTSNRNITKDKLINFFKNLKTQINFCIEIYQNMSDDVKYEVGDFICEQMVSMIRFKIKNKISYLEELDEIDTLIEKQKYDFKARGLFQIKAKIIISKRIQRMSARRAVLLYDYVMQSTEEITKDYNSRIEPLKSEYSSTAKTAFAIRKSLKEKIESLELEKKRDIDALGVKEATKAYNMYVKKFKIDHTAIIEDPVEEFVPSNHVGNASKPEVAKIDYMTMPLIDVINALDVSINKLKTSITRSECDNCKAIKAAMESRANEIGEAARPYLNSITMSVNMLFSNEQPAVMAAMIQNISGNILMQSNSLKGELSNK